MFEFLYFPCLAFLIDAHVYITNEWIECFADSAMSGAQVEACVRRVLVEMAWLRDAVLDCRGL